MTGLSAPKYVISSLSAFILKPIAINGTAGITSLTRFPPWHGTVPETQLYHG